MLMPRLWTGAYFAGYGPLSRAMNASSLSAAHPDPVIAAPYVSPTASARPGRKLYVVAFKCSRADIFYVHENTGLEIRVGDLVIVEGDRGQDLGQVTHADVTADEARKVKADALEEHFRWLVMFSQYSLSGKDDCGMLGALARANGYNSASSTAHSANVRASPNFQAMVAQQDTDSRPKLIKRVAQQHEVFALRDKEGQEAKAKRLGAQKAAEQKLPMEILDAEYQAYVGHASRTAAADAHSDYHKLTYFYYAETYVNFNQLVTDIFKHFKVRIWMSAVNPASVVNPAGLMQLGPPSAIGPGAILHPRVPSALSVGPGFGNTPYRAEQFCTYRSDSRSAPGRANRRSNVAGPGSGSRVGPSVGPGGGPGIGPGRGPRARSERTSTAAQPLRRRHVLVWSPGAFVRRAQRVWRRVALWRGATHLRRISAARRRHSHQLLGLLRAAASVRCGQVSGSIAARRACAQRVGARLPALDERARLPAAAWRGQLRRSRLVVGRCAPSCAAVRLSGGRVRCQLDQCIP